MKIHTSGGTAIYIAPRRIGGAEIIQGTSRIKLRANEMGALGRALIDMSDDAHAGKEMTICENQYTT